MLASIKNRLTNWSFTYFFGQCRQLLHKMLSVASNVCFGTNFTWNLCASVSLILFLYSTNMAQSSTAGTCRLRLFILCQGNSSTRCLCKPKSQSATAGLLASSLKVLHPSYWLVSRVHLLEIYLVFLTHLSLRHRKNKNYPGQSTPVGFKYFCDTRTVIFCTHNILRHATADGISVTKPTYSWRLCDVATTWKDFGDFCRWYSNASQWQLRRLASSRTASLLCGEQGSLLSHTARFYECQRHISLCLYDATKTFASSFKILYRVAGFTTRRRFSLCHLFIDFERFPARYSRFPAGCAWFWRKG